ncbi:P-loop containing nucleoside triphosphate hydrolase protein [Trichoderma sp. SZMC 28011]
MPFPRQKSCTHCRQSKLRCNRAAPTCSRCAERNLACDIRNIHVSPYSDSRRSKVPGLEVVDFEALEHQHRSFAGPSAIFDGVLPDAAIGISDENVRSNWMVTDSFEPGHLDPKNLESRIGNFDLDTLEDEFDLQMMPEPNCSEQNDVETWTSACVIPPENSAPISCWDPSPLLGGSGSESNTSSCDHTATTLAVRTPSNQGSLRSRPILKGCMLTNMVLGQITGYPKMLVLGDRLPPFIHAPCYMDERLAPECGEMGKHQCLPKRLAICASLVDMFHSRTDANADFVWQTISSEGQRLHDEYKSLDSYGQLAALQAVIIYILLQAQDPEAAERNGANALLLIMIEIFTCLTESIDWDTCESTETSDRQHWVLRESLRRIVALLGLVELLFEGLIPPHAAQANPPYKNFRATPLPSQRDLWEARTNRSWRREQKLYLSGRTSHEVLTVGDLLELDNAGCFKNTWNNQHAYSKLPDAVSDEGKGKLTDILAPEAQLCARAAGGHNAGHSIVANGVSYSFHLLPSGLVNPNCRNLIGSAVVAHIPSFFKELEELEKKGLSNVHDRIFISDRVHIDLDLHVAVDGLEEIELGDRKVGTTGRGIGPAYSTKAARSGIRLAEVFNEELFESKLRRLASGYQKRYGDLLKYDVEEEINRFKTYRPKLRKYTVDAIAFMKEAQEKNTKILCEGANALMLDLDWGSYPYVTSSSTGIGGMVTGLALDIRKIGEVIGVVKAYTTRVGSGAFKTEDLGEYGSVKNSRNEAENGVLQLAEDVAAADLVVVKYTTDVNHYTALNLTKLDVLDTFPTIKIAIAYEDPETGEKLDSYPASLDVLDRAKVIYHEMPGWNKSTTNVKTFEELPKEAQDYILYIENFVGVKIKWVGTGPDREAMITRF